MSLLEELKRRNVVRVGFAYTVIAWLLAQVAEFAFEAFGAPEWALKALIIVLLLGLPLVLIFAWAFEMTPEGIKLEKDVDRSQSITPQTGKKLERITIIGLVLVIVVIVAERYVSSPAPTEPAAIAEAEDATAMEEVVTPGIDDKSIAVLPFVSMTAAQEDEFFADGLSEELLNVLAQIDGLKVAGRTSSFYYKGKNEDLRGIAESLGVAHILEGSVRRSGNQIRVTAQLIKADDGFHLWSDTYDRADGNTFVIQDEIASSVADALQTRILGTTSSPNSVDRGSVEARNLSLIALASLARRTLVDVRAARDLYAQASTLAPDVPEYYAGYAQAVALQYWNFRDILPAEAIDESSAAINRALELGTPSADTLAIAGLVEELRASTAADPDAKAQALSYYEQAIAQDENNILALQWLASIYLDINKPAGARDAFEKVVELDPLNTLALTGLANAYFSLGLRERGRQHLYKVQSLFPHLGMSYRYLAIDSWETGRLDKASFWIKRSAELDPNPLEIFFLIQNYVSLGWADKALGSAETFRQNADGRDISRLVQAQLDHDFETLSIEAQRIYEQSGNSGYASLSAWADAAADNCAQAVATLNLLFPSLKGETIEYIDSQDLIHAVLLAHCNKNLGREDESLRLAGALLDSELLNDNALDYRPSLRMVRVGLYAVMGEVQRAIAELSAIDVSRAALAISPLGSSVDELPIFDSIKDQEAFRSYVSQERYLIAQQGRMLASGETEKEIRLDVESSGYLLADWR